jgi:hypothetical protein
MRYLKPAAPLFVALAALLTAAAGTAKTRPVSAACATPAGYRVVARDSKALIFGIHTPGASGVLEYRYCLRSLPTRFPVLHKDIDYSGSDIVGVPQLAGLYSAFVVSTGSQDITVPLEDQATVVNLSTGKATTVPDPIEHSAAVEPGGGCCQRFVLSSTGVFAGLGETYSNASGPYEPLDSYVTAYDAVDGTFSMLAVGPAGTLGDVQIFPCAAGCSSTTTTVVGWTSNGSQQYASLLSSS